MGIDLIQPYGCSKVGLTYKWSKLVVLKNGAHCNICYRNSDIIERGFQRYTCGKEVAE